MSSETTAELQKLREEVAALQELKREKDIQEAKATPSANEAPAPEAPKPADSTAAVPADSEAPDKNQIEELADLLQAEIKDLPTVTCLAVFSLGILMGRLMR
jgi:hypothetical protein